MTKPYQPKTGRPCTCKRGVERDNCPHCEGTGQQIDFAAIRERVKRSIARRMEEQNQTHNHPYL